MTEQRQAEPHILKQITPEDFINRELSWMNFNIRVLEEARDTTNPLFERLLFLSITSTNLDEFVMVRIGSLKDQVHANYRRPDIAGLLPEEQLTALSEKVHSFVSVQYSTYHRSLLPKLRQEGIAILRAKDLTEVQRAYVDEYFDDILYPIVTPMAVDNSRPFPLIQNESHNIAIILTKEGNAKDHFATVQVPSVLPRLLKLPADDESYEQVVKRLKKDGKKGFIDVEDEEVPDSMSHYILLEDVIRLNLEKLFPDYTIKAMANYRIMRNAGFDIDEEDSADLLVEIERQLKKRQWGEVIRMEIEDDIHDSILKILSNAFKVKDEDIYHIPGPIDLSFLSRISGLPEHASRCDLRYPPFSPQWPAMLKEEEQHALFEAISKRDIFLSLPYESFDPVLEFIRQAASDPDVLAIKQTLYRVSGRSPIIKYLAEAAENGKQVLVLVELKARFDEENNIQWARRLEQAGCHVIYGLVGLKTHSKITLVVRQEEDGIRRYVHLGTGNYNDKTAKLYTDLGLFTCAEAYGQDATEFFNMISGYAEPAGWNKLVIAPFHMRHTFMSLIDREIANAKEGKPAYIRAKMNSLVDEGLITKLYEASAAGVRIDLIVRGICSLRAEVEGLSENIHVRSLVGRYLEHARIYCFSNGGYEEVYMSSADWMTRNLDRRVEILFPVEDEACMARVNEIMDLQMLDTERARLMQADGTYRAVDRRGKTILDSMKAQEDLAIERNHKETPINVTRRLIPRRTPELEHPLQHATEEESSNEVYSHLT